MLDTLLLEDSIGQKLVIMEFFLKQPAGIYPINTVCSCLTLSHGTASSLLAEINRDLQNLSGYTFFGHDRKVLWQPATYRHNRYTQYLIRSSIPYQFVLHTLTKPEKPFATFCSELFLSESTVTRKLRPLKLLLQRFDLRLSAKKMAITGSELVLRMFYSTYLWLGNHGEDLSYTTFSLQTEAFLAARLNQGCHHFMHTKEIFLHLSVQRLRYEQGHLLEKEAYPDLLMDELAQSLIPYIQNFICENPQQRLHQLSLNCLFLLTPLYLEIDFRGEILLKYFEKLPEKNPFKRLVLEFQTYFFQEIITLNTDKYEHLNLWKVNFLVLLLRFDLIAGDIPMISDLSRYVSPMEQPLFNRLKQQLKIFFRKVAKRQTFPWLTKHLNDFVDDCTYALFANYKHGLQHDYLTVGIITSPDHYIQQILNNLMRQFTFVNVVFTTVDDPNVDFFLTTFEDLLPPDCDKPYFLIDLTHEIHCQTQLFNALWEAYHQKALQQKGVFP